MRNHNSIGGQGERSYKNKFSDIPHFCTLKNLISRGIWRSSRKWGKYMGRKWTWVLKPKDKLGEPVELDKCPEFCKCIGLVASWQIICERVKMYWNKYKRFFLTIVPKRPRQRQYIGRPFFEDLIRNAWKEWQPLMLQIVRKLGQVSCRHMGTHKRWSLLYNGRDEHEIMGRLNERMKKFDSKGCILASPTTVYRGIVFSSIWLIAHMETSHMNYGLFLLSDRWPGEEMEWSCEL